MSTGVESTPPAGTHSRDNADASMPAAEANSYETVTTKIASRSTRRTWAVVALAFLLGLASATWCRSGSTPAVVESPASATSSAAASAEVWTCAMHPEIRSATPGSCPLCGMDLVRAVDEPSTETARTRVELSPRAKQLARIETTPVTEVGNATTELRMIGRIDYDETLLRDITATAAGRVEQLHVRTTGVRVRKGQPIAVLYSPEIYAAAQEFVVARRQLARMREAGPVAIAGAEALRDAARERLELFSVPPDEIARLSDGASASARVTVRAQASGTVIERQVTEGVHVDRGGLLYRLADLGRVWLQLDAYERDLAVLRRGQTVEFVIEALAGRTFTGEIAFIDPVVDPLNRVARVRVEVANGDGVLRPGMVAHAIVRDVVDGPADATLLAVPTSAPLFTGRRSVVYVELDGTDKPTYEARTVRLGARLDDHVVVLEGLRAGERVVTHGAFALDADLQIRGGDSMMRDFEPTP